MTLKTCVDPSGKFVYDIHKPSFRAENMRFPDNVSELGKFEDGTAVKNLSNLPVGHVDETCGVWIFEISNPFPLR